MTNLRGFKSGDWKMVEEGLPESWFPVLCVMEDWHIIVATYDESVGLFVKDTTVAVLYGGTPLTPLHEQPIAWKYLEGLR